VTRYELALKRREIVDVATTLANRIQSARVAGDRDLVDALIYASTQLAQLADFPALHEVLDEVLEEDSRRTA
jgi:hypothetical protein